MSTLRDIAYQIDPVLWVRHRLGVEPLAWQAEFLRAPLGASVAVLTARQAGKTTTAAWAIAHHMLFTPGGLSVIARRNHSNALIIADLSLALTRPMRRYCRRPLASG